MRPKLQSVGYLPELKIRLNNSSRWPFMISFPVFSTSFNILSHPGALFNFSFLIAKSISSADIAWSRGPASSSITPGSSTSVWSTFVGTAFCCLKYSQNCSALTVSFSCGCRFLILKILPICFQLLRKPAFTYHPKLWWPCITPLYILSYSIGVNT